MISEQKIKKLLERYETVERKMSENPDKDTYIQLALEFSELEPVASKIKNLQGTQKEMESLQEMLQTSLDGDMKQLANDELMQLTAQKKELEDELQILLLPRDEADKRSAILEIRAGTGGSEAALFAGDLFRMYHRHCENCKWKVEVLSENAGEVGGYKEIVASITGKDVFARLKFESGVHRVQRVPQTESQGRVHTSAATVAVLPEAQEVDVEIKNEDIRIDTMRASGAGGQHVNTTDSAVRITHIETGVVVIASEKSQHQNRASAMKELRTRLYDMKRQEQEKQRANERKGQIGSGDRSQRIRTYNYPQGRISDHRINLTLYKLEKILEGEGLDEIIDALIADYQAAQLANVATDDS